jgi:hypothetical protein
LLLTGLFRLRYIPLAEYGKEPLFRMNWEVEYTDEFEEWWDRLTEDE